jgi:hypothetical protein
MYGTSSVNTPSRFLLDVPAPLAMVTHAPGRGGNAWSSPREERPGMTRQQARDFAARAFQPVTQEHRGDRPPQRPVRDATEPTYKAGDKVRHPTFGLGIVVGVRADPTTEIVDVNFAGGVGVKKLDTAFAPLSRE